MNKEVEEVVEKLDDEHKMYYRSKDYDIATRIHYAKSVLQQLIKENCESEGSK